MTCWRPLGADAVPTWVAFRPFLGAWHDAAKESWLGAKLEALGTWVLKTTHLSSWCAPEVCRACLRVPAGSRAPTPHPCSLASHEHWALGLSREEPRGGGSSKGPSLQPDLEVALPALHFRGQRPSCAALGVYVSVYSWFLHPFVVSVVR